MSAHRWEHHVPAGWSNAQAFMAEPFRKCANCGAVQQRETETAWMRIVARRWRPLAGRCRGKLPPVEP